MQPPFGEVAGVLGAAFAVDDVLTPHTLVGQPPLQRPRMHREFVGDGLGVRDGSASTQGHKVAARVVGGVPVKRTGIGAEAKLICLHGGAYGLGSARGCRGVAGQLAAAAGMTLKKREAPRG
jgi:acetyl esterase/lipase